MRQILLIARQLTVAGAMIDPQTAKFIDTQKDLHEEISAELSTFGQVLKKSTSGVFPRAQTPAPDTKSVELAPTFFAEILPLVIKSDCVVVVRDGQNDLRGAIVMFASMERRPVLALLQEPKGVHLPGDPLYHLPNITNVRFHHFPEAKNGIARFMNGIPLRQAAG
ncbi:hypothetical protein IPH19_02595 [Candidatus Uhrbacteria bacterium]|jgi:hypothetical protein|nr:MAG: hypothetical protein IPH19_02595 [Candidatus Uhrbacteria bacterium]